MANLKLLFCLFIGKDNSHLYANDIVFWIRNEDTLSTQLSNMYRKLIESKRMILIHVKH